MGLLAKAFDREPAAIMTVVLIAGQAVLDAMSNTGWTWATLANAAVTALIGLTIRQNVYSPHTRDHDVAAARFSPLRSS